MRLRLLMIVIPGLILSMMSCSKIKQVDSLPESHEVGIAYLNLESGEILAYNAQTMFHAASTMKTPVMFQLFRMRDRGDITLPLRYLLSTASPVLLMEAFLVCPLNQSRMKYYTLILINI